MKHAPPGDDRLKRIECGRIQQQWTLLQYYAQGDFFLGEAVRALARLPGCLADV